MGTRPGVCQREALDMVRAGLGYLAAADAAQLAAATQAECLRELEQADAIADRGAGLDPGRVHRRAGVLPTTRTTARVSWLIHQTAHHPAAPPWVTPPGPGGSHASAGAGGAGGRAGLRVGRGG